MKRQSSLLTNLKRNPLPDAFEIRMLPESQSEAAMEVLAQGLGRLPEVDQVEYGQQWIGRISSVVGLFRLAGYALGALFFMASVFIVANTVRLVLYSRRQEVEIMRLVGATDRFIKTPFYIEGLILGAVGGSLGLATLLACYLLVAANLAQGFAGALLDLRFLPPSAIFGILGCSMLVGWLGCFLSMRQFFGR
jgi:cell division transport system permease protein